MLHRHTSLATPVITVTVAPFLQVLHLHLSPFRLRHAWRVLDVDETNELTFTEFAQAFYSEMEEDEIVRMPIR